MDFRQRNVQGCKKCSTVYTAFMRSGPYTSVSDYISASPAKVRPILEELRAAIKEAAPRAEEVISYGMPAYKLNGILVYFGTFRHHIGFFPTPSAIKVFAKDLTPFKHAKGSIQFPLNEPLPLDLVRKIVTYRLKENQAKKKNVA